MTSSSVPTIVRITHCGLSRVFSADLKKLKIRAAALLRRHGSGVVRWRDEGVTAGSGLQVLSRGEALA
jgi:hypothetical protein